MKQHNTLRSVCVRCGRRFNQKLAALLLAAACAASLMPQQVRAAFTVFDLDAEGEDASQWCSGDVRDQCPEDWTTASDKFNDYGAVHQTIDPDFYGAPEWIAHSTSDASNAINNFIAAYAENSAAVDSAYNGEPMCYVIGHPSYGIYAYDSSGALSGLNTDLGDFGFSTCDPTNAVPAWPAWRQPLGATFNMPGMAYPLHVIEFQAEPGGTNGKSCARDAEIVSVASWVYDHLYGGTDPYIVMGDFNADDGNSDINTLSGGSTGDGLYMLPCNYPADPTDCGTDPTADDNSAPNRFDYILVSAQLVPKVRVSHVYRDGAITYGAADHYPVYAVIGSLDPDAIVIPGGSVMVDAPHAPTTYTASDGNATVDKTNTPDIITRSSSGTWSSWSNLTAPPPSVAEKTIAATNLDGTVQLFVIGDDEYVYTADNHTGSWGSWTSLGQGGGGIVDMAVTMTPDSRVLELFAIGLDGSIWRNYETASNNYTSWNGWISMSGTGFSVASDITVGHDQNGDLHVFFIGGNETGKTLYHMYLTSSGWSGFDSLGGSVQQIALQTETNGILQVWAADTDGSVSYIHETAANDPGSWISWVTKWTGYYASEISVCNGDGNGALFFVGANGVTYSSVYTTSWPTPTSMGGVADNVSAVLRPDGCIEVFQIDNSAHLEHNYQSTVGGSFSGWTSLSGSEL